MKAVIGESEVERIDESGNIWDLAMYLCTSHHREDIKAMGESEVERIDESGNIWDLAMYLHTSHHKGNI